MKIFKSKSYGPAKKITRLAGVFWWCLTTSPAVLIALGLLIDCLELTVIGTIGLLFLIMVALGAGGPE